ncbi:DUF3043 domain-containing protein [Herbiconiux sp. L3-i23]|uniref:DUF3043 domain-containing protein n=1 Tax=Herbiconiux sp. L3-i23 TaxID=2905871 RepID=UPI00205FA833|nr:DUF3043 domain-containing protein [Herbiconiux sp. L3-i23]BDI22421.1 hypothetical protein L3i23_11970 [Herbiconiux sp. L3-i23]
MAKQPSSTTPPSEPINETGDASVIGKGRSTPTRREREAANKRPLVPTDRREASKQARAKAAEARERARVGMANGEDRYLPTRDKGAQRKFVRDWVDARWSVGEFLIPIMFLVIIVTFIPDAYVQTYSIFALWGFFLLAVLDVVILGFILQRKLTAKFGEGRVERGFRWYAAMRALQLRPLRLPKPQVKRGKYPN